MDIPDDNEGNTSKTDSLGARSDSYLLENHPLNDSFPLINDLIIKSTTDENYFAAEGKPGGGHPAPASESSLDDDERRAALSELVTHLEDTAAMLRQYIVPPPDLDFGDHVAESNKTHFFLKYQILFVLFSQMVSILVLSLFDHMGAHDNYADLTKATGAILQILNMVLVLFATVVLSRQMLKHKVEGSFLAQTYVATVITFAGLYFMIYRFKPDSWEFGSNDKMEESLAISQYLKMVYLSVSAATLCGASNIQPRDWFTILILCFQSLVNFVYFASILAQTIGNYHSYTVQVRRSNSLNLRSS